MIDWRQLLHPQAQPQQQAGYQPQMSNAYQALAQIGAQTQQRQAPSALLDLLGSGAGGASPPPAASAPEPEPGRTVLVGDSLGVGTSPYLKGVQSNAVVGRSSASGVQALRGYVSGGQVGRVLFDLGTNDASASQLEASLRRAHRLAPGATFYVPTVNGPDASGKNALLRRLDQSGAIRLIDTTGLRTGPDGIHLDPAGYRRRAALIRAALG